MSNNKRPVKKKAKQPDKYTIFAVTAVALILLVFVLIKALSGGGGANTAGAGEDIKIVRSEITETARFYPYKSGKIDMEVFAVKASDGTIRTALNTCQVCFDSGRGYYKQQGDQMICQNCGNRFRLDDIEVIKGGCNPVPIMPENKTDDGTSIVISKDFMEANKDLFRNWKRK